MDLGMKMHAQEEPKKVPHLLAEHHARVSPLAGP